MPSFCISSDEFDGKHQMNLMRNPGNVIKGNGHHVYVATTFVAPGVLT